MKSKFAVGIAVAAGLVVAVLLGSRWMGRSSDSQVSGSAGQTVNSPTTEAGQVAHETNSPPFVSIGQTPAATNVLAAPEIVVNTTDADYVSNRIELLDRLSSNNDGGSLQVILSELTNADVRIRKAALEATIQFDSRDAIPTLEQDAATTQDPGEKQALLDAAKFLALPSIAESGIKIRPRKQTPAQVPATSAN